jgi:hypothetical protein
MSAPKIDRNEAIVRFRDNDGRIFRWIADEISRTYEKISIKNVIKIYYREKTKRSMAKRKQVK